MRQQVEPLMHIIDIAFAAMQEAGVEPKVKAIRGRNRRCSVVVQGTALSEYLCRRTEFPRSLRICSYSVYRKGYERDCQDSRTDCQEILRKLIR